MTDNATLKTLKKLFARIVKNHYFWLFILAIISMVIDIGPILIGVGTCYLYQYLKLQISEEEKKIFRENYKKLEAVITSVRTSTRVREEDIRLILEVSGQAKVELPEEIQKLVEKARLLIFSIHEKDHQRNTKENGGLPAGEKRNKVFEEGIRYRKQLGELEIEKIYSKYLRIKILA